MPVERFSVHRIRNFLKLILSFLVTGGHMDRQTDIMDNRRNKSTNIETYRHNSPQDWLSEMPQAPCPCPNSNPLQNTAHYQPPTLRCHKSQTEDAI